MKEKELVFEEKIEKAKELLNKLSKRDIALSDSLDFYKTGMKELEDAQKLLDEAKLIFKQEDKQEDKQ